MPQPSADPALPAAPIPALTDRLLRSWLRCRRRAWLDRHGPAERRRWSAHRALSLQEEQQRFAALLPVPPGRGDAAAAAGAAGVVGLRLRGRLAGVAVEAHPPLLQRVEQPSRWGAHGYRPVLARQGYRLTREHRLVLTLWGRLLAEHQRAPVAEGLVLGMGEHGPQRQRLPLGGGLPRQLEEALARLADDLGRRRPPPLVSDRKKCVLCSWRGLCDQEAAAEGHLSEVSGIGGKRRDLLLGLGITSLPQLAACDPHWLAGALEPHGDQHRDVAPLLVAQARVQAAGRAERRPAAEDAGAGPALPELAEAAGVLLYDIESDPDARDDFLHGFLILKRGADGRWPDGAAAAQAPYLPLLALQEHGEARLWRRLQALLARYPHWPLLHYGETEAIALLRLGRRCGAAEAELVALKRRLVDVHQRLRQRWRLPVNSYGLKAVAGWLGFRWSQKGVDGARCLLWWRQWRQAGPAAGRRPLERIFRYNADDSLATWAVARWLLAHDDGRPAPTGGATNASGSDIASATPAASANRSSAAPSA
ncbi:MAG: TM0106 family RecB-like putative nuclease [Cyanobacteriota bacterium]|nr:TM0106 family RecB-like putative nuclease [Cyanobacteriota bacterium]